MAAELWHSSNGMPTYLRRVLLTRWVGEACRIVNADTERMLRIFQRTGSPTPPLLCEAAY